MDATAGKARRAALAAQLGNRPALIAAGLPRRRNYAANVYPFRASSHFLYLVGLPLPGAVALYDGAAWTLYVPDPGPDDALWEGPAPSCGDIAAVTGCAVRSLSDLPLPDGGRAIATLPAPDLETCSEQARLIGREVRPGAIDDAIDGPLADAMIALRLVHDAAAIAELELAASATTAAHRAGMRATRPGAGEAEVRAAMEAALSARGMTCAYPSIVTVHGEILHNQRADGVLEPGDLLLADVGAETAGGWAGDVTRTWPVSGKFLPEQRDLYEVVLAAQRGAIAAVAPGVRYRDIHLLAARALASGLIDLGILRGDADELVADGVLGLLFPHGVGHLLGLDVHDMEDLGDRAGYAPGRQRGAGLGLRYLRLDRDLVPGMALTIEPGLYLCPAILDDPELSKPARGRLDRTRLAAFASVRGIRIEDDVLVTPEGARVLTASIPKSREAVEAEVAARA
jgi:Xaa-Pro aminopeptidase